LSVDSLGIYVKIPFGSIKDKDICRDILIFTYPKDVTNLMKKKKKADF